MDEIIEVEVKDTVCNRKYARMADDALIIAKALRVPTSPVGCPFVKAWPGPGNHASNGSAIAGRLCGSCA
jgi:hypothetical protein